MEPRWWTMEDNDYVYKYRHVSGTLFHAVRADADPDSSDDYGDPTRWSVGLVAVDLAEIERDSVARSVGWERQEDGSYLMVGWGDETEPTPEAWAEAAIGYGAYAPLHDVTVHSRKLEKTIRKMMRMSFELEADEERYEDLMAQPVNAIGSTAAEFMQGDIYSALHRGVAQGDEKATLITKMYRAAGGNTLGTGNVLHLIPELPETTQEDDDGKAV